MTDKVDCIDNKPFQGYIYDAPSKAKKSSSVLTQRLKSLFSNIGLFLVLIALFVLGGFMFMHLEMDNELRTCHLRFEQYQSKLQSTLNMLLAVTSQELEHDDTVNLFKDVLGQFAMDVVKTEYEGTNCSMLGEEGGAALKWSLAGSTMFSLTVLTTVEFAKMNETKLGIVNEEQPVAESVNTTASTSGSRRRFSERKQTCADVHALPQKAPLKMDEKTPEKKSAEPELTDRQKKIKSAIKMSMRCLKFSCGNLGLLLGVFGYTVLGGYVFQALEGGNEITGCTERHQAYNEHEADIVNNLLTITAVTDADLLGESYAKILRRFRTIVYQVDYDGTNCTSIGTVGGPQMAWSFFGATVFALTVTTTIGYGHIAPKTYWGQMVCIAYAVLGIPLMLLFLANIGDVLADFFKFFYSKICCCGCCRRKDKNKVEEVDQAGARNPNAWKTDSSGEPTPPAKAGPLIVEDDEDDEEDYDDDNITIPLTVTMAVIFGYIMFGAVLFGMWESWSMSESAYFCFVTLSTIGFGDFVPGKDNYDDPTTQVNMIIGAFYMLLGLAILSMCFSLIQDEIAAKFRWLGSKLGLVDNKSSEEAE